MNLPDHLKNLSPEMRELLLAKLKKNRSTRQEIPQQPRSAEQTAIAMALAQQRLWFLDTYMGPSAVYNLPGRIDIRGRLDIGALERALDQLIARHEVLRTRFPKFQETQVIDAHRPYRLVLEDLSSSPRKAETLEACLAREAQYVFNLAEEHLFRARLWVLGDDWHVLSLNMHHIIGDGQSTAILVSELERNYLDAHAGRASQLPALAVQYADYAVWHRQHMAGEAGLTKLNWWRTYLEDVPNLELNFDRPRPARQSYSGALVRFALEETAASGVRQLASSAQTTPFVTLLAVFQSLLLRYSGMSDLTVGVPFANREHPDLARLIGFFVNTLPVRAQLEPQLSFLALIEQLRQVFAQVQSHQDVAFESLVDQLGVARDPSHTPLFQVTFNFLVVNPGEATSQSPSFSYQELFTQTSKFDISLAFAQVADRIYGEWSYNPDLFDEATTERMIAHFCQLLRSALAAPKTRLQDLIMLTPAELALTRSGDFARLEPMGECVPHEAHLIHQIFEAQAARNSAAIALVLEQEQVSYGELNAEANRLAAVLRQRGVAREARIGLCLERTPRLLAAILAVLKAGAVYVPLDPNYPADRLEFIARDANLQLILAEHAFAQRLPAELLVAIETLDLSHAPDGNFQLKLDPKQGAYIIYTSGSTGKPKGVLIPHENVVRLFGATNGRYHFGAGDCWTLFHSYAFDFTVWEIWGALFFGGRLVIVPYLTSRSPADFHQLLVREQVTVLSQSPSAFRQLVHQDQQAQQRLEALRYVVFGAEALDLASLLPFTEKYGDQIRLINMYGITETTVHVTWRPIARGEQGALSPIGKAIADLRIYIVDRFGNPVPVGVPGEILVGGAGLARGYFNRPGLTAERFPADPFSAALGARIYRTGDKACFLPDGNMVYLGRIDQQIKIRGFRIEPGEIQAALANLSGVRENAVLPLTDDEGRNVLVAYIVPELGAKLEGEQLREQLKRVLPEYMVPSFFCCMERFPLTAHDKLDRRALPGLNELMMHNSNAHKQLPESPTEEALAMVWSEGLGGVRVGRDDNFFNLGGDSIRAIRVLGKAREHGLDFDLQLLFRFPTVKDLAREIEKTRALVSEEPQTEPFSLISAEVRARLPEDIVDAYPMAHLQLGMIYEMKTQTEMLSYHDVASFVFQGEMQREALETSLALLCARHAIFRTSLHLSEFGEPLQLVHQESQVRLAWIDLSGLPEPEREASVQAFLAAERKNGFDLRVPALVRYTVHALGGGWYRFTQTLCHPILDGWSTSSSIAELFDVHFRILETGNSEPIAPPRLSYRDFIYLEQYALKAAEVQAFWREHLADFTPIKVPRWPKRPADPIEDSLVEVLWKLVPERVAQLRQLAQALNVPLKSIFLAAYFKVLSFVCGDADIAAGLQVNGRNESEGGDKVLGLFLNAVPARMQVSAGSWHELIQKAFRLEWTLMPFRRYPTAAIQRAYDQSVFETFFNYVSFHSIEHIFRSAKFNTPEGGEYFEPTHFPYFHGFNLDPVGDHVSLVLQSVKGELPKYQLEATRDFYDSIFADMALSLSDASRCHHHCELLPEPLRVQLLHDWNATAQTWPQPESLLALIDAQVARVGEHTALCFQGVTMSYAELNERAERVAAWLLARGIGLDGLVGMCVERSFHMIVGLYGILKTGAAYVPLDPHHPVERLVYMLEDAQVATLLTTRAFAQLPFLAERESLCLDLNLPDPGARNQPNIPGESGAYMIYTSGSTGRPKGALNSHRAIVNRLLWKAEYLGVLPDERILHKTPYTFDVSVWELFLPLLTGSTMVIAEPEQHKDVAYLLSLIVHQRVTLTHFVPSMLAPFLKQRGLHLITSLRHIVCSGEALPAALVLECHQHLNARLHNLYGPTEAAIDVSAHDTGKNLWPGLVPIGAAIANVTLYVLDAQLMPVAPGSPGELYLGGVALARGYHRRPGLTASRFVPDRFSSLAGQRLYRSGDKARFLPNGELDYLGRLDNQIKLRGFRIELGEITAVLERHPAVRQGAVLIRTDREGNGALVAYLTCKPGPTPDEENLIQFLAQQLPEYMVPQQYCVLETFPMTLHGKLDIAALPELKALRQAAQASFEPPQTATEELLARIWCECLGLERVGREDHFFRLGGDSIISLRIVALAEFHGLTFSIALLHQHSVLKDLALQIERGQAANQELAPIGDFGLISADLRASLPEDIVDAYPMSKTQLGMIYHMELETELMPYFNVDCCLFQGHLDKDAFFEAVAILVRRHAVLRTSLHLSEFAEPLQLVHREAQMDLFWEDLRGQSEGDQQQRIRAFFEEQVARPFDITKAPLLRYGIQVLSENRFQMTLVEHHALVDGWSFNSMLAELFDLVFRIMTGTAYLEPEQPKIGYRDFVRLERQAIASPVARGFWKQYLDQAQRLRLPRWPQPESEVAVSLQEVVTPFSAEHVGRLQELCRTAGTSLKSALLAAHVKVLGFLGNTEDVLTSIITTGRPEAEGGDRIYGLFFNTMPYRVTLASGTWFDLVRQVFEVEQQTLPHRRVPLAVIQEDHGSESLFETMFNYINFHVLGKVMLPGSLAFVRKDHSKDPTHFPLRMDFNLDPISNELYLIMQSAAPNIGKAQLEQVSAYYERVLRAMAADPQAQQHRFDPLSEQERRRALATFQADEAVQTLVLNRHLLALPQGVSGYLWKTGPHLPADLSQDARRTALHLCPNPFAEMPGARMLNLESTGYLREDGSCQIETTQASHRQAFAEMSAAQLRALAQHAGLGLQTEVANTSCAGLFAARALATPDAAALSFAEQTLSYAELDSAVNRLANHLLSLGAGLELRIGVCLQRDPDLITALLAVQKTGATYVPMDPEYPDDRLEHMMTDSGCRILIGMPHLRERGYGRDAVFVSPKADAAVIAQASPLAPPCQIPAGAAMYLIYTSGSTGKPKGVAVTNEAVVNFLSAMAAAPGIDATQRLLAVTTVSFDIAVLELFLPLSQGAELVLATREQALDADALVELMQRHKITMMQATPATWQMLRPLDWHLETLLCGGEALPADLAVDLLKHAGRVWNMYGPTETTIWSACRQIEPTSEARASEPIGGVIANTSFHVLDPRLRAVAPGEEGELYIGGSGLARGYMGQPGRTASVFVPSPWPLRHGGERLYRTGDLVCLLADGTYGFRGRVDHQIKLHGHRIELGEIEAVLRRHIDVAEAVVVLHTAAPDRSQLTAYFTGQASAASSLRSFAATALPEYMLPASYVHLDELPRTPNRKIDRKALQALAPPQAESRIRGSAPRTAIQRELAAIWCEVLGLEEVFLRDDFFSLGGQSLLATRAVFLMRTRFGIPANIRLLFDHPELELLAAHIETLPRKGIDPRPALVHEKRGHEVQASYAQKRMYFAQLMNPKSTAYNMPFALNIPGTVDDNALDRAFRSLVDRHETLRTSFIMREDTLYQRIHDGLNFNLSRLDLRGSLKEELPLRLGRLGEANAKTPMQLDSAPLLRAQLIRTDESHVLMCCMHHIVADGWSIGIFFRELEQLYLAYKQGEREPLKPLKIHYTDYTRWQLRWMSGAALEQELQWWRDQLRGAPFVQRLPGQIEAKTMIGQEGSSHRFVLDAQLTAAVEKACQQQRVSLFMLLYAAYIALLHANTGEEDMVLGTDLANRGEAATEAMIGFFVNQIVLRTDLSGDPSFSLLLKRVRQTAVSAYAHQDLPFDLLVDELNPARGPSQAPFFQRKFVLNNLQAGSSKISGITTLPLHEVSESKVDLQLNMEREGDCLVGFFNFKTEAMEVFLVQRLALHFQQLLAFALANPEARLSALKGQLSQFEEAQKNQQQQRLAQKQNPFAKNTKARSSRLINLDT